MDFLTTNSINAPLLRSAFATIMAIVGICFGALLTKSAARRLNVFVYTAMGVLLLVTVLDILPDAKHGLTWAEFAAGVASGVALFWLVGKYIYHICPSCALHTFDEAALHRLGQTAFLFMIALGIHATMDGLAVVVGDEVTGRPNLAVFFAVAIHKLPEGMALVLLLLGAGYSPKKAFWWSCGIESLTELGALAGVLWLRNLPQEWLSLIFAHVGGGFLYLVGTTLNSFNAITSRKEAHAHSGDHTH
jgi:zinc transporter ZupT